MSNAGANFHIVDYTLRRFLQVMVIEMKNVKAHVLVLSYPATGHTNPMLQFSKSIASRGLLVTFVTFSYNHHKIIRAKESLQRLKLPIQFECIPDDLPQDTLDSNIDSAVFTYMNTNFDGSKLEHLIQRLNASGNAPPVCCIVYNPFLPWARQVSKKMKIPLAMFWTQCTAVFCIYHHFNNGETWDSKQMPENMSVAIPSLPELQLGDLPSAFLPNTAHSLQPYLEQMNSLGDVSWVLANTFYELEAETIEYLRSRMGVPFQSIGPCIPSAFLDGRNPNDTQVGADPWKATASVKEWLDNKPRSSVAYISFGSVTVVSTKQIYELAFGIQCSGQNFLWVIRPPPGHEDIGEFFPAGFAEETKGRGLVVDWCVQLEILSHPSVAAFMSHCGWNSTLEALSLGVPVLTLGMWTDQITNSKFLADVWKAGVRMRKEEDGIVGREEIDRCMRMVVDKRSKAGEEVRKNALKWKELAKTAMSEGGSSDTNLNEFVEEVVAKAT